MPLTTTENAPSERTPLADARGYAPLARALATPNRVAIALPRAAGVPLNFDTLAAMNTDPLDIEAYARTGNSDAVVSLLSRSIGPLVLSGAPEDEPLIYQSGSVSVVLQRCEDGFLSVWVRGSAAWSSCSALGRHLAKELGCVVRCDPGNEFPAVSPYSNVFLEIDACNESLVPWG